MGDKRIPCCGGRGRFCGDTGQEQEFRVAAIGVWAFSETEVQFSVPKECWTHLIHKETEA